MLLFSEYNILLTLRYLLSTDSLYYNQTLAPNISVFNMFNITTI
jgi:hypothetical protein